MIGEKIRKIRTLKGYSQDYMSEKLKMSQPAYSELESGKTKIAINVLQEIAQIFELQVDDLINFDEKQVFHNTFNQNSKGFFKVKKFFNESFEYERQSYKDQIKSQKEEIDYLRKKLDEK
jgi:XRE family transcriptional regulator, regulator of sulfur utilization